MRRALRFAVLALAVAAGAGAGIGACGVGEIDLENRACPCGPGYVCDTPRNVCVRPEVLLDGAILLGEASAFGVCRGPDCGCASEADCYDPRYPKCDGTKCVQCSSSPDNCPVGSYCLPSHECAPGCKSDQECSTLSPFSPFCNTARHQCVECVIEASCTGGKKCSPAGSCVVSCTTDGGACAGGATCCDGLCIDTTADPLNCGRCGGLCTGSATLCCASTCTDPLTSVNNCGTCGAACNATQNATGASCSAGRCKFSCNSGYGHCQTGNTGCETVLTNNPAACGSCSNDCNVTVLNATGISCAGTTCGYASCMNGFYELDGKTSDGCEPCGDNGQSCCPGDLCAGGSHCEPKPAGDGKCH